MSEEKPKLDLRTGGAKSAPSAADALLGVTNKIGIPMAPGSVTMTNVDNMSEYEKDQLTAMGWQPGDAIPINLADKVQEVTQAAVAEAMEAQAKGLTPIDPNTPPLDPDIVDITSLPIAKQEELQQFMKDAQNISKRIEAAPIEMYEHPSVNQAVHVAGQAGDVVLTNDLADKPKPAPAPAAAAAPDSAPESAPEPEPEHTHDETGQSRAGATSLNRTCARCKFNVDQNEPLLPTDDDKRDFLISTLGQIRFYKVFKLFGGKMQVKFRSLTRKEADLAYQQLTCDVDAGKIDGRGEAFAMEYSRRLIEYRLAMGLESVITAEKTYVMPEIGDVEVDVVDADGNAQTALPSFIELKLYGEVLPQESLSRAVAVRFMWFQSLVENLEANLDNEDFWNGIEQQL